MTKTIIDIKYALYRYELDFVRAVNILTQKHGMELHDATHIVENWIKKRGEILE